jgi:hexosaminidase
LSAADAFQLLPAPRRLERTGDGPVDPEAPPQIQHDGSLPCEGFELWLSPEGILIRHRDASGLRYARSLLDQVKDQAGPRLPGLRVRDWPDFAVRGYMLDVSRDRVPTRESLERLVEQLALFRINHLQLYTEHTFAYSGHEVVWREASPLDADDVRWLDERCSGHGIELAANQNCFGHMERWLRHDAYRHLAEAPDGFETRGGWRPAGTLTPNRESLAFVRDLLAQLRPHFTSRRVNVGCDETFDLGRGRSADAVKERGIGRVYLEFLRSILDLVHERGGEALFWGDILRHHPRLVPELPQHDTVALAWHYEAPLDGDTLPAEVRERLAGFGLTAEWLRGFESHVAPFASSGLPFWVCPGTSTWNALLGRWPNARANLRDAAEVGLRAGAAGFLITDWGDNGHLQPPSQSLLPIAYGAALAWCLESNRDVEIAPLLDRFVFEDAAGALGGALESMGSLDALCGLRAFNASPLHAALLGDARQRTWGDVDREGLDALLEKIEELGATIGGSRPRGPGALSTVRELQQALRLARHGAWRLARQTGLRSPATASLHRDLVEAIEEQRACWLASSRPGGLRDSSARLQQTLAEYV